MAVLLLLVLLYVSYVLVRHHLSASVRRLLVPTFALLFVLFAGVAVLLGRHRLVRRGFLAVFFSVLLLVNLTSLTLLPVNDLYKFSEAADSEEVVYQMYVADGEGDRLRFDRRIVPTVSPPTSWPKVLLGFCSPDAREQLGRYLLSRAQTYRESLTRREFPTGDWVDFPRHHLDHRWTRRTVDSYGRFTELVIDEVTLRFEPNSHEVESRNRSTVYRVGFPDDYSRPDLSSLQRCS